MLKELNELTKDFNSISNSKIKQTISILRQLGYKLPEIELSLENKEKIVEEYLALVSITYKYSIELDKQFNSKCEIVEELEKTKSKFELYSFEENRFIRAKDKDYLDEFDRNFYLINKSRGYLFAYFLVLLYIYQERIFNG